MVSSQAIHRNSVTGDISDEDDATDMSGSSSDENEDDSDDDMDSDSPPRRARRAAPSQPRKTEPSLAVPTLEDLLQEKQVADRAKQRRAKIREREQAEDAAKLAETQRMCEAIMGTVAAMDDLLPPVFRRDAGRFADAAAAGGDDDVTRAFQKMPRNGAEKRYLC